jgi:hypothetical protein
LENSARLYWPIHASNNISEPLPRAGVVDTFQNGCGAFVPVYSIGVLVRTGDEVPNRETLSARRPRLGWLPAAVVVVLSLAAFWPALINGGPFYMADTPSYIRGAASGFFKLFHLNSEWANEFLRVYGGNQLAAGQAGGAAVTAGTPSQLPVTLSGRSIFYGVFLFLAHLAGSLWIVVAVQSFLAAACMYLTVDAISRAAGARARPFQAFLIGIVVLAATPLAYFTSYLMPDVFGGFALLAAASLVFLWDRLPKGGKAFWLILLAYSLLVHNVNLTLVTVLLILATLFAWWRKLPLNRYQLVGIGACIAAAMVGQAGFGQVVKAMTGASPVRPPFIAMRLIADGPGYAYLKAHCSTEHYIYCRVLSQTNPKSDTLLWTKDPRTSLFRGLSPDEQRQSAAEQPRFVKAVAAERPGEVLGSAIRNSIGQLVQLDLNGFNYSRENRGRFRDTLPPKAFESLSESKAFRNEMPTAAMELLSALTAIISAMFLLRFASTGRDDERRQRPRAFSLCILTGIALNAVICGSLSGPKGRYEMRLIWVLPLVAGAIASTGAKRKGFILPNGSVPEMAD